MRTTSHDTLPERRRSRWRARVRAAACLVVLCFLSLGAAQAAARGNPPDALALPATGGVSLYPGVAVLVESGDPLTPEQALAQLAAGDFTTLQRPPVPRPGGAGVWLYRELENTTADAAVMHLLLGTPWTDRIDVYLRDGIGQRHQVLGDASADFMPPLPGQGYGLEHRFAPGRTTVLIRAESVDPLLLPLRVYAPEQAATHTRRAQYAYGFLYGYLLALLAVNLLMHVSLRQRQFRDYAVYLLSFAAVNIAYTGHGWALLWPGQTWLQDHAVPLLMVLCGYAGMRFAFTLLRLDTDFPRLVRGLRYVLRGTLGVILLAIVLDARGFSMSFAFAFNLLFGLIFIAFGLHAVRRLQAQGGYFLVAALSLLLGMMPTLLAGLGLLPFNGWTLHAVEIGMALEAGILALAVAGQVRANVAARQQAERLADIDPLTGLLNRRAFQQQGEQLLARAREDSEPLTLVLVELKRYAQVRQGFGQAVADWALRETARLVNQVSRSDDPAARWNEDTFALLLPRSTHLQARAVAERICAQLAHRLPAMGLDESALQSSFGVAGFDGQPTLDALLSDAAGALAGGRG
jgi:diguanylate cyclase (GGDEF)-like protein